MSIKIIASRFYIIPITLIFLLNFISGCSSDDEGETGGSIDEKIPIIEPIEAAMKTMTPLGYAASMFMAKINETNPTDTECVGEFCITTLEIPFDQATISKFPVPLETEGVAKLYVAGAWSSSLQGSAVEAAVITLLFIDMKGGSFGLPTYKITAVPVTKTSQGISTAYATSDLGFDKDERLLEEVKSEAKTNLGSLDQLSFDNIMDQLTNFGNSLQDGLTGNLIGDLAFFFEKDYWLVTVNEAGNTPDDYTDDEYGLTGGGLYAKAGITSGSVQVVGLKDVIMQNSCVTNPNSGTAYIAEVEAGAGVSDLFGAQYVELLFDDQCDGKAFVQSSSGSYGIDSGQRVPLQF